MVSFFFSKGLGLGSVIINNLFLEDFYAGSISGVTNSFINLSRDHAFVVCLFAGSVSLKAFRSMSTEQVQALQSK